MVICPRLALSVLLLLRKTCTYSTHISTFLCKAPLCLLRKQIHLPHPNDFRARPRGVYPDHLYGGRLLCGWGVFGIFVLIADIYSGFYLFSLKIAPLNTIGAFTRIVMNGISSCFVFGSVNNAPTVVNHSTATGVHSNEDLMWRVKNGVLYGFLGPSWVLITLVPRNNINNTNNTR